MEAKGHSERDNIPVIDLAALPLQQDEWARRQSILTEMANACKNWGAFQLVNHGIETSVIEKARAEARKVFELPSETRWKAKRPQGSLTGYGNGAVTADAVNTKIASEAITFGYPESEASLVAAKLWPHGNPDFGVSIDEYNEQSHKLGLKVMKLMVEGLVPQVNTAHFRPYLTEQFGVLRINNYPVSNNPAGDIGLPSHIDDALLTIIHQGCEAEGLELLKDGEWVTVPARSDAMIVLVSAVWQVITNDTYKAVVHRAVSNRKRARLSLVYSAYPPTKLSISPAPEFVSLTHPPLYKPFTWSDYMSGQVSHILNPIDGLKHAEPESHCLETLESNGSNPRLEE